MRAIQANRTSLPWIRRRSATPLSGFTTKDQDGCLATTGHQIRTYIHTARSIKCSTTRTERRLATKTSSKPYSRLFSTHIGRPTALEPSTTVPEKASAVVVAEMLRTHREEIEATTNSPSGRRELACARNVGLQALTWLQQLDELDEQHVIPKQLCMDLGWFLVAEGNEQPMIPWLLEDGSSWMSSGEFDLPSRENYNRMDKYGIRSRRRHNHTTALVQGKIDLSLDGTANDAIKCLHHINTAAQRLGVTKSIVSLGSVEALDRAISNNTSLPVSALRFDEYMCILKEVKGSNGDMFPSTSMYHPTAPDPWPMFHRMRDNMADPGRIKWKATARRERWDKYGYSYVRAMVLLQLEGAVSEANAVSEMLQEDFAPVWRKRHQELRRIKADPKLKHLMARYAKAVSEDRPQDAILEPYKLPEDDVKEPDDPLADFEPEIEEPDLAVSTEILELRSRRK